MNKIEKETLLENLLSAKEAAFATGIPNAPAITEIVSQLSSIKQEDKSYFKV